MTTAILLVAGVGSRLRPLTDEHPKCLVSLGDETILARQVRLLAAAGVTRLVLSTGFAAAAVRAALADATLPCVFVHNPDYATTQNIVSLHRALAAVTSGDVLKLDGDVVFTAALLPRLLGRDEAAVVAVDDRQPVRDEAMKVRAVGGAAERFGKGIAVAEAMGESIGVEWFSDGARGALAAAVGAAVRAGRTDLYYEDVYAEVIARGVRMACVGVGDLPWTEVDDLADLARAVALVRAAR
jgi:choline kinase